MDAEGYLEATRDRLSRAGFREEASPAGAVLKVRRREVKLSRFGLVETVVAISDLRSQPGPDHLRTFGDDIVRSARDLGRTEAVRELLYDQALEHPGISGRGRSGHWKPGAC